MTTFHNDFTAMLSEARTVYECQALTEMVEDAVQAGDIHISSARGYYKSIDCLESAIYRQRKVNS
jgi:hypothetical protein